MSMAPWNISDVLDDLDDKCFAFNYLFNDALSDYAPIKTIKIRGC